MHVGYIRVFHENTLKKKAQPKYILKKYTLEIKTLGEDTLRKYKVVFPFDSSNDKKYAASQLQKVFLPPGTGFLRRNFPNVEEKFS